MAKELLKITHIKDGISSVEIHTDNEHDLDVLTAGILSMMDHSENFAKAIIRCAGIYFMDRKGLSQVNQEAQRSAEVKLKN